MTLPAWRRRLRERLAELDRLVKSLDLQRPLLRGSLYRHRIRCGRPGCHCAEGPGHLRWCLSYSSAKGRHTRSLSPEEVRRVSGAAEAYRRYRQIRAEAARVVREIFRLIDRIARALERPVNRSLGGG